MSPGRVVRGAMACGTVVSIGLALATGDARWWAVSAAAGTTWWVWDLLVLHVFQPLEDWFVRLASGGLVDGAPGSVDRPSLDETITYLERHLARPTSRQVDLNAARRLVEIYRTVKRDPARAAAVIRTMQARYPDAPELAQLGSADDAV